MARLASKMRATYDDVVNAPDHLVAEILAGELVLTPRPAPPQALAEARLYQLLAAPFVDAVAGPGGWVMLQEVELHFSTGGLEVLVPDVVGWLRARLPELPKTAAITVTPDWVCEVLSPRTEKIDRARKMEIYAREGVGHLWFLEPVTWRLEAYSLSGGVWQAAGVWDAAADRAIRAVPFDAVALDLGNLSRW